MRFVQKRCVRYDDAMQKLSNGKTFVTIGFLGLLSAAALTIYATSPDNATRVVKNSVRTLTQPTPKAVAPIVVEPIQEDESPEAYQGYEKYAIGGSSRNDSRNVGTRVAKRLVSQRRVVRQEAAAALTEGEKPSIEGIVRLYEAAILGSWSREDIGETRRQIQKMSRTLDAEYSASLEKNPFEIGSDYKSFRAALSALEGAADSREAAMRDVLGMRSGFEAQAVRQIEFAKDMAREADELLAIKPRP